MSIFASIEGIGDHGDPEHLDGPSVEDRRDADRRWPLQKTGE